MSIQTNIRFKDVDVDKALSILHSDYFITPPSPILVLKDIITTEEVR